MTARVLAVGNSNTDQVDHRSLITSLVTASGSTGVRSGLFPHWTSSPGAISNVSAMVVGISPLKGIINNTLGAGHFLFQSDSQVNLTFDAGEPSVARLDRIIVRVYNDAQDASGQEEVFIQYLKGQPSGSASSLPANSLLLWEVSVPAGASAGTGGVNFTGTAVDKRVYTVATGGVIPTNAFDIDNPYEGMVAYNKATDILYVYDGTNWRPKGQINVGNFSAMSTINAPETGTLAVARDTGIVYEYSGASWFPVGLPTLRAMKQTDQSKSSTTTLAADPELVIPNLATNATYELEGLLIYAGQSGTGAGGMKVDFTVPSGATLRWVTGGYQGAGTGTGNTTDLIDLVVMDNTGGRNFGTFGAGTDIGGQIRGILETGASTGSLTLRWAQGVSDATATVLRRRSYLKLTRVY